jgi:hypothetical protein
MFRLEKRTLFGDDKRRQLQQQVSPLRRQTTPPPVEMTLCNVKEN